MLKPQSVPVVAGAVQELNDRDRFLQVLLEKYQQASAAAKQAGAEQQQPQQSQQPGALLAAAAAAAGGGGSRAPHGSSLPVNAVSSGPPLLLDEAVAVIIRNERGRQVGPLHSTASACWLQPACPDFQLAGGAAVAAQAQDACACVPYMPARSTAFSLYHTQSPCIQSPACQAVQSPVTEAHTSTPNPFDC